MHTMAGLMNGWRTEFHLEMWEVGKLLFRGTPDPVDNRVQIPDAAGLGFEPDLDVLRDSRITQPAR
jgi:L-alanine-DL-glutamate epimerase-like enolase superfamily enzyme